MKFTISQRILILVVTTIVIVAWPLLYISEEMYQNHITKVVNESAQAFVKQTLLVIESKDDAAIHLDALSSSGRLISVFDVNGVIHQGDDTVEAHALYRQLLENMEHILAASTPVSIGLETPRGWDCVVGYSQERNLFAAVCHDRDHTYDASSSMQLTAGALALLVLGFGVLGAKLVSVKMTRPLRLLAEYARDLPNKRFAADNQSDFHHQIAANSDQDIVELTRAFAYMENELVRYIQKEKDAATERERIKSELRIAAEIQQGALPQQLTVPDNTASVKAQMLPAREVGGDLYDYFIVDEHTVMFSLGDVSGKGVPAALFMFATQHMLRSIATQGTPLVQLMAELNDNLSANNTSAMFVTMFVGRYDLRTNELEYALAGHQPPLLKRANGTIEVLKAPANLPIGNVDGMTFESRTVRFGHGDNLMVFTDGVTEACNSANNLFGMERLITLFGEYEGTHCEGLLERVFSSVEEFSKGCEMHDDVTILCFANTEPEGAAEC